LWESPIKQFQPRQEVGASFSIIDDSREKVQYGYLPTFDDQKNLHRANRTVRNLLNLASTE
jgi:hypothetical protein